MLANREREKERKPPPFSPSSFPPITPYLLPPIIPYPLTRMTDNYALLNSLYRDNWVVQNVVGIIPDDMTKKWFAPAGAVGPEHLKELDRVQRVTALRERVNEGLRWGRLYGGAAGLIMIRGQEGMLGQPLELESIYPGTFQGLYILDRWQGVVPGMELVFEGGEPVPAYYSITDARGNTVAKVHHSRLVRFTGRDLPFLERVAELYWGESEVEALYNDVVKHDNVAANMAALTFRANVDTMEVQNLDQLFSVTSGEQQRRFWNVMQAQSVMKSNFGMQLVNRGDQIKNTQYTFTGLQEVYDSMCLDLSGASRIPVTKLFGRSPAGMNATGESDLRNYYDYVDTLREAKLRPILEKLLPVLAMSAWGAVPDGLDITFPPLWTPTAAEVAEIALKKAQAIRDTFQAGLFRADTAQRELKKLADETGMFDSISEEEIAANAGKTYQDVTALRDPLAGMGYGGEVSAPFESIAQDAAVMDYPGQPRDKNGRFSEGKMLTEGIKSGKIPLLDRTVGRNQTVTAMGQDGSMERYKLAPGSKITDAYIFAGGPGQKPISVAHFLEGKTGIPASQWRKAQGHGVVLNAGAQKGAVLHWFEANGEMYSVKVVKWE